MTEHDLDKGPKRMQAKAATSPPQELEMARAAVYTSLNTFNLIVFQFSVIF